MTRRGRKRLVTLKKRAEFQRVRGGGRVSVPGFVLEGKTRPVGSMLDAGRAAAVLTVGQNPTLQAGGCDEPRFGFTITRKIGNAVKRNRIRRRLKAALSLIAPEAADAGTDYVVVARVGLADQDFAELTAELKRALGRVNAAGGRRTPR